MPHINWKKTLIGLLDMMLIVYLGFAVTSFNNPDETMQACTKVGINISDSNNAGFLTSKEIKSLLERQQLYPLNKPMKFIDPRKIEEVLCNSPFVSTAQCYKTKDGHVNISITQRMPIVRIKSANGDDYYLDDKGGILPNSNYTSDLIITTGNVNKWFAQNYISLLTLSIMDNDLWKNQIEQINILADRGVEVVPRVGDHIIFLGYLPQHNDRATRKKLIDKFVAKKFERLEKFYRYGLSVAGWNKYYYINLEFDNQIICKRNDGGKSRPQLVKPTPTNENHKQGQEAKKPEVDESANEMPVKDAKTAEQLDNQQAKKQTGNTTPPTVKETKKDNQKESKKRT